MQRHHSETVRGGGLSFDHPWLSKCHSPVLQAGGLTAIDGGDPVSEWPLDVVDSSEAASRAKTPDNTAESSLKDGPEAVVSSPARNTRSVAKRSRFKPMIVNTPGNSSKETTPVSKRKEEVTFLRRPSVPSFVSRCSRSPSETSFISSSMAKGKHRLDQVGVSPSPSAKKRKRHPLDGTVLPWPGSISDFEDLSQLRMIREDLALFSKVVNGKISKLEEALRPVERIETAINAVLNIPGITWTAALQEVSKSLLEFPDRLLFIQGFPGTGKTLTLTGITAVCRLLDIHGIYTTPTHTSLCS
ncbi:hypothetical protein CNMCM6936_007808 [Aspergillus lentulus]|nr:hypothetical protein CNMCM6936_007808 [Aspergillus lentulus]KAF4174697.1 hypothetical protein CNMCM8060_008348 [Aspergillus lentulus]KAF4184177.1 hypothetical protein CNMCM7927_008267 [Aspergillus lentulus]KAF4194206.1 hypothetical protein CNMCM8694_007885 [Aspergillus lentulus]